MLVAPGQPTTVEVPRCGDIVKHLPSGEEWVVAWCEGGDLAWCGWPNGVGRTADCEIVQRASEGEFRAMVRQVAGCGDSRASRVRRLHADMLS